MSSTHISRLRLIGIIFWLAGGAVITFGWMGMAQEACVDCQMPFLLSGGAAGIGLIIVGSTLVLISTMHDVASRNAEKMAELFDESPDEVSPSRTPSASKKETSDDSDESLEIPNDDLDSPDSETSESSDETEAESDTTVMPKVSSESKY